MEKSNVKRLVAFGIGALVLYYLAPLILAQTPEQIQATGSLLLLMIVNQIFIGVVGWQSTYIPKFAIYIPIAVIILYVISELLYYGGISWTMELNYLETGYIVYFLKKLLTKRQRIEEKKNNRPFPKGVGKK